MVAVGIVIGAFVTLVIFFGYGFCVKTAVVNSTTAVLVFKAFFSFFFDVPSLFTKSPAIRTYVGYRFLQ